MRQVLPHVVEWKVSNLELSTLLLSLVMIKESGMLKLIQEIKFPAIQVLNLKCNSIESIEGLSRMDLKLMKSIFLCTSDLILVENCISSTSEIAKVQWPSLSQFSFCNFLFMVDDYKYQHLEPITKGRLPQVTSLTIEWAKSEETTCQSITEVIKLESNKLDRLGRDWQI